MRRFQSLLLSFFVVMLAGCGFQLRGEVKLSGALSPMFVTGVNTRETLYAEIQRNLNAGGVLITEDPARARSWLKISGSDFRQNVLSVDARGKVVEYELAQTLAFSVLDRRRKPIVPQATLVARRSFVNPETTVLGKSSERDRLRDAMQRELVRKLMARLRARAR